MPEPDGLYSLIRILGISEVVHFWRDWVAALYTVYFLSNLRLDVLPANAPWATWAMIISFPEGVEDFAEERRLILKKTMAITTVVDYNILQILLNAFPIRLPTRTA